MERETKSVTLKLFETPAGAERLKAAADRLGMPLAEFLRIAAHKLASGSRPTVNEVAGREP